jgi:ELWxxDGT repeat protein
MKVDVMSDFLNNIRNLLFSNRQKMSARKRQRLIAGYLTKHWRPCSTRRQRPAQCPSFEQLEVRTLLTDVSPLIDIETTPQSGSPTTGVDVNGVVYFSAESHGYGRELWKTNGTTAGTSMVADINVSLGSSNPTSLTNVNGTLYFTASNAANGAELWKTDGTAAGTQMIKDIAPGLLGSSPGAMFVVDNNLVFAATGNEGTELWKSDGTAAGTVLLKDIRPGVQGSAVSNLVLVSNTLYFAANDGSFGTELWRSDGTTAGTYRVSDIAPGALSSSPSAVTSLGSELIFSANDGSIGRELWKSTGVAGNASLVKDIQPGSVSSFPDRFGVFNGFLYFNAQESINGSELWRTDGTSGGTALVKDLRAGTSGSGPTFLANLGSKFLFSASTSLGTELFESDGTPTGTTLLMDIFPGTSSSTPASLGKVGSTLYFRANNSSGIELWKTDGTATGTVIVKNISAVGSSTPSNALVVGNSLLFSAFDDASGNELWKSDGTAAGTVLVKDIYSGTLDSNAGNALAAVGGKIFFAANTASTGSELWVTTGSAATTSMVIDILPGSQSGFGSSFTTSTHHIVGMNGQAYFAAKSSTTLGVELWKSDGTAAGTAMVKDINPLGDSSPADLINVNGTLFFTAQNSSGGIDLWKSDGTSSGTVLLRNLSSSRFPTRFSSPRAVGNTLYFVGYDITTGNELWKSDGTVLGTTIVTDINPGSGSSSPGNFVEHNGQVYFTAFSGTSTQIWKTNGSAAGTVIATNFGANSLFVSDGLFYMSGYGPVNDATSSELWKWDGTSNVPVFVKDIAPGLTGSSPSDFHQMNGYVLFQAQNDATGRELWRTDGTSAGTVMVKDIAAGTEGALISNMVAINGQLYFRVSNSFTGTAMMRSDGTAIGTTAITTRNVNNLTAVGSSLYFNGSSQEFGSELYRYEAISLVPTNIGLSNSTIAENSATGTTVGSLIASGSDTLATTFALAPNALDNAKFSLAGTELRTAEVFDYEAVSHYVVRVTATSAGVTISRDLSIFVGAVNEFNPQLTSPTALSVAENTLTAATFSATDPDSPTPSFTYSIVGGADAARFTVSGNRLSFAASPNFEAPTDADANNQYIVQVAVSDGSRSQTNTLTISVTNVNEAPTNIALSNLIFAESLPAGSVVGTLSATDADGPNPITFAFSTLATSDNIDFEIVGDQLRTKREFDFETLADQQLMARVVASDGFSATSLPVVFNLSVTDAEERPTAVNQSLSTTKNNAGLPITLSGSGGTSLTYAITSQPTRGILTGTAPNLVYVPSNNFVGTDEFFFTVRNSARTSFQAKVEIVVVGTKPTVQFSLPSSSASEGAGTVSIGLLLSEPSDVNIWIPVQVNASSSTATTGVDFSSPATSVFVPAGQTTTLVSLPVSEDESDEPDEVITIQIGNSPEFLIGVNETHILTIADNDLPPVLSLSRTHLVGPESNFTFGATLLLSAPLPSDLTIGLTVGGSATAGVDYENEIPNSVTIPAGATSVFVPITLLQDSLPELPETIVLMFDGSSTLWPAGTTVANRTFTLALTDDDQRVVNMSRSFVTVGENHGTLTLKATLSHAATAITRVPFLLRGNAQYAGSTPDYSVSSTEFVFAVGAKEATVSVVIINDILVERVPESLSLKLQSGTSYAVGTQAGTTVAIVDNDTAELSFTLSEVSKWEGDPAFNITATLSSPIATSLAVPITISLGFGNGYAGFADYSFPFTTFVFAPEALTSTQSFLIANDSNHEPDEVLSIHFLDSVFIGSSSVVARGRNVSTRVRIRDNDPNLSVVAANPTVSEGKKAVFKFSLNAATNVDTTIPFFLTGTAKGGSHYTKPVSQSVVIPEGETAASLSIATIDNVVNSLTEPDLTLLIGAYSAPVMQFIPNLGFVTVRGPEFKATVTNAKVIKDSATVTIRDNDETVVNFPTVDKKVVDLSESRKVDLYGSENRTQNITVALTKASDRDIDVTLAFSGKATRDKDYKINGLTNDKIRVPAGRLEEIVTLEILDDTFVEGNETLEMTISAVGSGARLPKGAKPKRTLGIIDDDKEVVKETEPKPTSSAVLAIPPGTLALDLNPSSSRTGSTSGSSASSAVLNSFGAIGVGTLAIFTGNQGPIDDATAYFDGNFNLILDDSEPRSKTALDGSFSLELDGFDINENGFIEQSEGRLVLFGGVDLASGLDWTIPLTAPVGLFNITPISTLVESLIRVQALPLTDGIARVTTALNIKNYDLLGSNSLYEVLSNDGLAAKAYNVHTQLYSSVISVAQLLAGKSGRSLDTLGLAVFDQIARLILSSPDSVLDLTSPEIIESIIRSTAASEVVTGLDDATILSASVVISGGTSRLAAVSLTAEISGYDYLRSINRAKTILQGSMPDALFGLGSGTKTTSEVEAEFTGTALDLKIAAVNATVTVPPAIGIESRSLIENHSGQRYMRFSVAVVGEHDYPISTDFFTVDGTADEGSDYAFSSGTLTWAANNNDTKYIDVPIFGDSVFEADEYFKVLLTNPDDLVIRIDEGYGFILNDEAALFSGSTETSSSAYRYLMSDSEAGLLRNGEELLQGEFALPLASTVQGLENSDHLAIDFSKNSFRADGITFHGGDGARSEDTFSAEAGLFDSIRYSILGSAAATVAFKPENFELLSVVSLTGVESSSLLVSELDLLELRVPSSVGGLIVEDVHISETGRMRIRSTDGSFAPIEFTNPTGSIRLVLDSASTLVAELSRDPGFSGTIDVTFSDVTKPISSVSPLPSQSTLSFVVTATGTDPNGSEGSASGLKEYDLYVSSGGAFTKFATVPAGSPTTTFTGSANTTYWFRSLGRDKAGNVESKTTSDTFTRIGDVVPPSTNVTSAVPTSNGLFTIQMTGTKPSGTPITAFDVYVVIDGGEPILVGAASSVATGGGNFSGMILFQGILDGVSHTYRFYSRGRDGSGNVEVAPVSGDVSATYSFASAGLTATAIDVQNGVNQRSYVRYLDVLFSTSTGLSGLLATGRVKVERFGINATSVTPESGTAVTGFGLVQNGNKLRLDFGLNGLGGLRQAGNGFYRILLDLDGNGMFTDAGDKAFEFHRLFGDANGDAKVDVADTNLVTSQIGRIGANLDGDLDGNGSVNSTDRLYTTQQRGQQLLAPLLSWLDD